MLFEPFHYVKECTWRHHISFDDKGRLVSFATACTNHEKFILHNFVLWNGL